MKKTLRYLESKKFYSGRDTTEYIFYFSLIDTELIGSPEEKSSLQLHKIKVSISGTLEDMWNYQDENIEIEKVLFEYGKKHLIEKVKENTNIEEDELWLATNTAPSRCQFDSTRIIYKTNEAYLITVDDTYLMSDYNLIKIATSILETRDYINAIIKERHNKKLFIVQNERDLLQLFISANTSEEFTYRLSGLKNIVVNLNDELLREITGIKKSEIKNISLFEEYLKTYQNHDDRIIKVLRNINRLRQAYPIHGDNVSGVQEAHVFFDLPYPIINPNVA